MVVRSQIDVVVLQAVNMYKCSGCEKLFTTMAAVTAHTCTPNIIHKLVSTATEIGQVEEEVQLHHLSTSQVTTRLN